MREHGPSKILIPEQKTKKNRHLLFLPATPFFQLKVQHCPRRNIVICQAIRILR